MRKKLRRLALLAVAVCYAGGIAVTGFSSAAEQPNLVVILCDDLGYGDLECYGHPKIKTPHLNRLAKEGIRFTDFYSAAPVCSPSRVGLLTGRSPNRAGVYDWIPPAGRRAAADAREKVHLRAGETTIAHVLSDAGYATCLAGKWHCNSAFNRAAQPQPGDHGFDHWFATQNNAAPSHENPINYVRNGESVGRIEGYSCQIVVDEVLGWLDALRDSDQSQPFFAFLAFHEPHEPVASPPALVDKYWDVAHDEDEAQYFANVANVDAAVGRFVAGLDQRGLRENTLIVFTSDNGPETLDRYRTANRSYGRPGLLRGMKLHTHEAGFRVAGIMNWPGRIDAGQEVATPVSSLDLLPTFCRLAGVNPPADLELDGVDCLPAWDGESLDRERPLVWCYYNALNDARVAMRDGPWKVLAQLDGGALPKMQNLTPTRLERVRDAKLTDWELYDMHRDVSETTNLATSRPELARRLAEKLESSYRELVADSHAWQPDAAPATEQRDD
ncbi:MAG: sulfatase-like hydrolase/transferase [Planctomycetota bacterium]